MFGEWLPRFLAVIRRVFPVGRCGQREGKRRPPEARGEETPDEELARLGAHLVEPPADDPQRDDAGALLHHLGDAHSVPDAVDERDGEAPGEERQGRDVERYQ